MVGMLVTPFFVFNQLGGTARTSGLFGSVQAVVYAAVCLASTRYVARATNGLNWALTGILLYAVLFCLMPLFSDWRVCLLVSSVASGALALVWPALHSWVGAEADPAVRSRTMGWFNISWSFGFCLSPLVAGPLYDVIYWYPFVLLGALAALAWGIVWSLPHESSHFAEPTEELLMARAKHDQASEAFLYCGWFATFVANLIAGAFRFVYPKRIEELVAAGELRLFLNGPTPEFLSAAPATAFSVLAFTFSLCTAITFLVLGGTSAWQHKFGLMVAAQAAAALGLHVLGRTDSLLVMILCCVIGGANLGLGFFAATYYSLASARKKHGRLAVNEAAVGFGGFVGSLAFGFLAERYGISAPFVYSPLIVVVAIVVQYVLLRRGWRAVKQRSA
ncbi:MAG: hypothetical protein AMXMBFR4_25980 [Candidatus Hydrogenedentota bacterium]